MERIQDQQFLGEFGVELAAATRLEANGGLADWSLLLRVR